MRYLWFKKHIVSRKHPWMGASGVDLGGNKGGWKNWVWCRRVDCTESKLIQMWKSISVCCSCVSSATCSFLPLSGKKKKKKSMIQVWDEAISLSEPANYPDQYVTLSCPSPCGNPNTRGNWGRREAGASLCCRTQGDNGHSSTAGPHNQRKRELGGFQL